MIGLLRGKVVERTGDGTVILDVGGVGFEVHVPANAAPPCSDEVVTLHVDTIVRDDAITLFGFPTRGHRIAFRLLKKVKNIGPKLAMNILSTLAPEEVACALSRDESERFRAVPGIGPKTAQYIIVELRDQVRKLEKEAPAARAGLGGRLAELTHALEHLGFPGPQAREAALAVKDLEEQGADLETLIREALKTMS
jgi:Holliday junction DNA helicase RuvA